MKAGVLALQGDFREHARALETAGATPIEVRTAGAPRRRRLPGDPRWRIDDDRASSRHAYDLVEPIRARAADGMPIFGTCAGMIVMAERVDGGEPLFGVMDIGVQRNAYGRQVDSFETDVTVEGIDHPVRGVFIRAPRITDVGPGVRVLAEHEGAPVVLEQGTPARGIIPSGAGR